jgi:HEAT repeat protein
LNKKPSEHYYSEEELLDYLIKLVDDKRDDFSIFAIRELKHFNFPKTIELLVDIVNKEPNNRKKEEAIRSLKVKQQNKFIKQAILKQISSPVERVRSEAAELLKEYGESLAPELQKLTLEDLPKNALNKSIWLLGQIGDSSTIDFFNSNKVFSKKEMKHLIEDAVNSIKSRNVKLLLDDIKKKEME